jgi:hypothetical protein
MEKLKTLEAAWREAQAGATKAQEKANRALLAFTEQASKIRSSVGLEAAEATAAKRSPPLVMEAPQQTS